MRKFKITVPGFLVVLLMLLLGSCDRKPSEPVEPREYAIWMSEGIIQNPGVYPVYRWSTLTQRLDTFYSNWNTASGFDVSSDGNKLFVEDHGVLNILDADSLGLIDQLTNTHLDGTCGSNKYLVTQQNGDLSVLRQSDLSPILQDTLQVRSAFIGGDNRIFYGLVGSPNRDTVISFPLDRSREPILTPLPHGAGRQIISIHNGSKFLLYLQYNTFDWAFAVYDVPLDSFVYWHPLTPGWGEVAVTPDEHYAVITNPGTWLIGPPPPSSFLIFDLETNDSAMEVDVRPILPDTMLYGDRMPLSEVSITPDGKRALLVGRNGGHFVIYNFETKNLETYTHAGYNMQLIEATCQNRR
ncbi:MAG: hypothetical protein IPH75_12200 [bacterium]|nr:hypothetical protein [bacterium]